MLGAGVEGENVTSVPFILGTTLNRLNHTNSSIEKAERIVNSLRFTARHSTRPLVNQMSEGRDPKTADSIPLAFARSDVL